MTLKAQTRRLWKLCFDDTDTFLDLYFSARYRDGINYVVYRNNQVISALQTIPYTMYCFNAHCKIAYVSGACTAPEFRQHGVMEQLLKDVHQSLFRKDILLCTLIPGNDHLWEYYRKAGYASVFVQSKRDFFANDLCDALSLKSGIIKEIKEVGDEMYDFFSTECSKRKATVLHDADDLDVVMKDLLSDGGAVFAFYELGRITGIAFCKPDGEQTALLELLTENETAEQALLSAVFRRYPAPSIRLFTPVDDRMNASRKGMARIINAHKLLTLYAAQYPSESFYIELYDPVIVENNGHYFIRNGHCVRGIFPQFCAESYTVEDLTRLIFAEEKPFMNLMLE